MNHLNWCFPLDLGRLKRTSFSAFLCFSECCVKENSILQYFSKYFICEFLYFSLPLCLSTMQHLTPDLAFCNFRQGRHCLPNSRYTTGILFSTRFYSTWSLCVQCVEYGCVWMCVCLLLFCCQNHTQAFCKEATAGLRAGHQAPRFSFSGASSDPAT